MILILSTELEFSTSKVMEHLGCYNKEVIRINGDSSKFVLSELTDDKIIFKRLSDNKQFNILESESCWWRRTAFTKKTLYSNNIISSYSNTNPKLPFLNEYMNLEIDALKDYINYKLFNNININLGSPIFELNRLRTLDLAKLCGLNTPCFKIISNTNQICNTHPIVTKAISDGVYESHNNYNYYTYTEVYEYRYNEVSVFPSLIMDVIDKDFEIRSFFIDDTFYSMAIFSQRNDQTTIDFRKYDRKHPNRTEPFIIPSELKSKLIKLIKLLNINTGSIDLIKDKNDNYYFLEINPVGQFEMVSAPCGYNLNHIIAKYLVYGKP